MNTPRPKHVHLGLSVAWAGLLLPTLLLWSESILWVAFMSLYANFIGHISSWQAARAEEEAEDDA